MILIMTMMTHYEADDGNSIYMLLCVILMVAVMMKLSITGLCTLGGDDTFEIIRRRQRYPVLVVPILMLSGAAWITVLDLADLDPIVFAGFRYDRLQGRADVIKIEQTLDTDAVVTVHVPDAFEYVVGGACVRFCRIYRDLWC